MPHGALIEPRLMADEIEAQIEEAANMGEPPSFALARHQADWLVAFLRKAQLAETASVQARYDDALIRLDVLHLVVSALAAKADVSNEKLLGLFREAEEELRAKRWLT